MAIMGGKTNIGIIGAGYVADFYINSLKLYPQIKVIGVTDRDEKRTKRFSRYYGIRGYDTLDAMLSDSQIEIVLNLTNPKSHFVVSKAALLAGKHVYSEKPLALSVNESLELGALADAHELQLSGAPCTVLNHSAQTLWSELRKGSIGRPILAYAEYDDGLYTQEPYQKWKSKSGSPWPFKDELAAGCVVEHAVYPITWLATFFGPVRRVVAFSSCLIKSKCSEVDEPGPDFAVAAITFSSGLVCRLTCSTIAPRDRGLTIVGDRGILRVANCSDDFSAVYVGRRFTFRRRTIIWPFRLANHHWFGKPRFQGSQRQDFASGVVDLAAALREGRPARLSDQFVIHVNEVACAINEAREDGASYDITSSFDPMLPMPQSK
jgi:predicted dehydrogenase